MPHSIEEGDYEPEHAPALISEPALSDWVREEEDAAWQHLQPRGDSGEHAASHTVQNTGFTWQV
jgi:hypothetical protein